MCICFSQCAFASPNMHLLLSMPIRFSLSEFASLSVFASFNAYLLPSMWISFFLCAFASLYVHLLLSICICFYHCAFVSLCMHLLLSMWFFFIACLPLSLYISFPQCAFAFFNAYLPREVFVQVMVLNHTGKGWIRLPFSLFKAGLIPCCHIMLESHVQLGFRTLSKYMLCFVESSSLEDWPWISHSTSSNEHTSEWFRINYNTL